MTVCLVTMIKHDFPGRWADVIVKIDLYLKSDNPSYWLAGIIGFSALVKAFEYQKADKSPIHSAVKVLLPSVYNVMGHIVTNSSAESVALQKTIVKSYFKLIQVSTYVCIVCYILGTTILRGFVCVICVKHLIFWCKSSLMPTQNFEFILNHYISIF